MKTPYRFQQPTPEIHDSVINIQSTFPLILIKCPVCSPTPKSDIQVSTLHATLQPPLTMSNGLKSWTLSMVSTPITSHIKSHTYHILQKDILMTVSHTDTVLNLFIFLPPAICLNSSNKNFIKLRNLQVKFNKSETVI